MIDLTPLVQGLAGLAFAAVTAAIPFIVPLLSKYLNIITTAEQAATIQNAADVGAKAAYGYIASTGKSYLIGSASREDALTRGIQHVLNSAPDALVALKVSPEHIRAMVEARFGGLLAIDPTVSIEPDGEAPADDQPLPSFNRRPVK